MFTVRVSAAGNVDIILNLYYSFIILISVLIKCVCVTMCWSYGKWCILLVRSTVPQVDHSVVKILVLPYKLTPSFVEIFSSLKSQLVPRSLRYVQSIKHIYYNFLKLWLSYLPLTNVHIFVYVPPKNLNAVAKIQPLCLPKMMIFGSGMISEPISQYYQTLLALRHIIEMPK